MFVEAVIAATENESDLEEQSKLRAQTKQIKTTTIDIEDGEGSDKKRSRCS